MVKTVDPSLNIHNNNETKVQSILAKLELFFDDSEFACHVSLLINLTSIDLEYFGSMTTSFK